MGDAELIAKLSKLEPTLGYPGQKAADRRDEFWDLVSQNISQILAVARMAVKREEYRRDAEENMRRLNTGGCN